MSNEERNKEQLEYLRKEVSDFNRILFVLELDDYKFFNTIRRMRFISQGFNSDKQFELDMVELENDIDFIQEFLTERKFGPDPKKKIKEMEERLRQAEYNAKFYERRFRDKQELLEREKSKKWWRFW